jgi:signal transduction histidine kinase
MARVLVVDDQMISRMAVTAILEAEGHEVASASSGEQGIELATSLCPDVIILDVYMPGMDGFAVVERLKSDPRTEPSPVIFLTAEPPTDDLVVKGLELGAYDFLSKGCSRAELLARVGVMARIKRGNDELSAVARISDTLIQSLDPDDLSGRFVEQVRDVFRADGVLLGYSRGADARPEYSVAGLTDDEPLLEVLADALHELLDRSDDSAVELCADDLRGPAALAVRRTGLRSILATRVADGDREPTLLAVLTRREQGFTRVTDAPLLQVLARQATIALDNAVLHDRARSQARAMAEQARKLEKAMSERSRFFASMSHELRTPINAVIGYNQLLELGAYGEMNSEQALAVQRVSRSAQHLLELINDILDISKIEAGKMEMTIERWDLARLIEETVTTMQIQAQEKGIDIQVDLPGPVETLTDGARVRQILLNLLSNAVKFTDAGSVEVRLRQEGEALVIDVTDSGIGIEADDIERIFEEFEQTNSTPGAGGTGLGLPISRRLAGLLGGELRVRSVPGEGSTFTLTLPRREPEDST